MISSRQHYEFALLAILCATAVLLFPAVRGPYSAVHGPVTALRSLQARLRLWWTMAQASVRVFGRDLLAYCQSLLRAWGNGVLLPQLFPPELTSVLRC